MLRILKLLFLGALIVTPVAWFMKGTLVAPSGILPELRQEPVQTAVSRPDFSFAYKGQQCLVRPVALYEQWGLVVSHNNIESVADLYHDSTSVDTKDLCVIWGPNLESADYRRVSFRSGSFTCYFRYPAGVRFTMRAGANNHLITDSQLTRERIDEVRVGDQVRLKGMLVNYRMDDWGDFWRKSSLVRTDDGCEVVFVEELEILRKGTPVWYALYRAGWITLLAVPVLYLVALHLKVRYEQGR
jgi:hypothetical protein